MSKTSITNWFSDIHVVNSLFNLTKATRLNRQISGQQCGHQTKGPLVFAEITPIFRYLENIDETQEICILPYPHCVTLIL